MKKSIVVLAGILMIVTLLTGCAEAEESIDPASVEVSLAANPDPITAGSPVELQATFSGIEVTNNTQVTFDFRSGEKPTLIDAAFNGSSFTSTFTFPEKGIQTVYVHLYVDDIHVTKKEWVEVK